MLLARFKHSATLATAPAAVIEEPVALDDAPATASPAASSTTEEIVFAAPAWLVWLESAACTAAAPALGYALHPGDPLYVAGPFAWPLVVPLLVGLRHGFAPGFASALALSLGLGALGHYGVGAPAAHAMPLVVGLIFVGMVTGEYSQRQRRALAESQARAAEQRERLDELERALALLRLSHDRLEQRAPSGTASLRAALTEVRAQLSRVVEGTPPFFGREREILGLLARFAAVQVASLHAVIDGQARAAAARLGDAPDGAEDDRLCREALRVGAVVSVRDFGVRGGGATMLLAAVPLIDVRGRTRGIVAVREMPFLAFTDDALKLLAVVAGHIADALADAERLDDTTAERPLNPARDFEDGLRRCLDDKRKQGLPAAVCAVVLGGARPGDPLVDTLRALHRGPDRVWLRASRGGATAWLLLPLTDEPGLAGFVARLHALCGEHRVRVHARLLDEGDDAARVVEGLGSWSRIAAAASAALAVPLVRVAGA